MIENAVREALPAVLPSVLFVSRAYPPVRGGMEQFSFDLTTSIAARTRTHIIANRRGKAALPFFFPLAALRALPRLREVDILHLGDPVLAGLGWFLNRAHRLPTAMTIHGLDIVYPNAWYQRSLRRFLPSVDLCICISASVEHTLHERFGLTRTIVIPPGIHDTFYRPESTRTELPRILGMDPGARPLLLTVGRLVRRKGVAWFVTEVLPRLPGDVLYVVVGTGPERAAILSAARASGVSDRVLLTGAVDDNALRVLYNTADVVVLPNILVENDIEGFGLVALEAASCQRPVVASALQGIVDAVYDGRNGVLVASGDAGEFASAILKFCETTEARRALGETARAFTLAHFSWTVIAQKYLDAFRQLRHL